MDSWESQTDPWEVTENRTTPLPLASDTEEPIPLWETVITGLVLSVITLLTLAGNILVLLSVLRHKPLRIPPNYFIASLAVSDIAVAVVILPFSVVDCMLGMWIFGKEFCKIWMALNVLCCSASIAHLGVIAIDRFCAIKFPIAYARQRSLGRILAVIGLIWLFCGAISSLLLFVGEESTQWNEEHPVCLFNTYDSLGLSVIIGLFYGSLLITTIIYARLFVTVRRRLRVKAPDVAKSVETRSTILSSTGVQDQSSGGERYKVITSEVLEHRMGKDVLDMNDPSKSYSRLGEPMSKSVPACDSDEVPTRRDGCVAKWCLSSDISDSQTDNSTSKGHSSVLSVDMERHLNVRQRDEVGDDYEDPSTSDKNLRPLKNSRPLTAPPCRESTVEEYIEMKQRLYQTKERKLAGTLGLVMSSFVLCWLPFFIMYLVILICDTCQPSPKLENFVSWLGFINSTLNPIIYTVFNAEFRRAFKLILHL